ncbi:uncharacterized protein METZ01_LOCUS126478 [marine metagenome]|uniref:Uncharacterized protein n=1 Tax=marine metagenome TaxID=408172 RepID=A0A381Y9E7_9ZZZZ
MAQISFSLHLAKEGTAWESKTIKVKSTIRIFKLLTGTKIMLTDQLRLILFVLFKKLFGGYYTFVCV